MSVMRLTEGRVAAGSIHFQGRDLASLPDAEMRRIRGGQIGMIFQEPMTSLNPVLTIGRQIDEVLVLHQQLSARAARARRSSCCSASAFRRPSDASCSTRTSSPAA